MARKEVLQATRTYLVEDSKGTFRIRVPADHKVTFGPLAPSEKGYSSRLTLRIYEAENKQRAVFTDVKGFRDLSLEMERLVKTEEGAMTWKIEADGSTVEHKAVKKAVKAISPVEMENVF